MSVFLPSTAFMSLHRLNEIGFMLVASQRHFFVKHHLPVVIVQFIDIKNDFVDNAFVEKDLSEKGVLRIKVIGNG